MSKIQFDCELMLQPFPERLLTDAEGFRVLQDDQARPIMFCIVSNGSLLMIAPDDPGQNHAVDLSKKLNLPAAVSSLVVTQDQADKNKIYLAVATGAQENTGSRLHVLKPFQITSGLWWNQLDWESLVLKPIDDGKFEVYKLLLASRCDEGQEFPFIAAETSIPEVPRHNVSLIKVDIAGHKWQWEGDAVLPFDVSKIECLCVASSLFSQGILYLDRTHDQPTVTFAELRTPGNPTFFVNLPILPNPTSITTITDPDGASNILITGDGGILHVPAQDWNVSVPAGTTWAPTLNDEAFRGAHEVHVAQDGRASTVWAINGDGNVIGQNTLLMERASDPGVLDLNKTGDAIPLFPTNDTVRHFEGITDEKSGRQWLFVLKTGGSVTWFEQAGDSNLWSTSDLRIPDVEEIKDVTAYTCQIQCFDQDGAPMANTELRISTSSEVRSAIHGEVAYLGKAPKRVQTDEGGNVTILLPAADLVVPTMTIAGPGLPDTSFRPADKVLKKLSTLAQSGKLKEARKKDGSSLFPGLNDDATKTIGQLYGTYSQQQGASLNDTTFDHIVAQNADAWASADWGFLQGLISGVEKVVDFVCEAGRFIVKTLKKSWDFIVKTAEEALKAISSVFEWIGAKIEDAIVWLAEQLDWESIMDVQLYIKSVVLTGLDCVEEMVVMGSQQVDHLLERAEKVVESWHTSPELPESLANQQVEADPNKDKDKGDVMGSPLCKWADSKMQDKQVRNSMAVPGSQPGQSSPTNIFEMLTEKLLKPLWEILGDTAEKIWEDFKKLFDKSSSITMADIFKNIGVDLLLGIIKALRKSANFIMELIAKIVSLFRSFLNEKLDIWILTKLYKRVSGGEDLTMLNLACLIFSVPATYLFKLFTLGKKPRDIAPFSKVLSELRKSSIFDSLAPSTQWDARSTTPLGQSLHTHDYKTGNTWGDEHVAAAIKRNLGDNPKLTTFVRIIRGGMLLTSCAMPLWTLYDVISTSKTWPTALDPPAPVEGTIAQKFAHVKGIVALSVTSVASVVSLCEKTNNKRESTGIIMRWCLFFGKTGLNIVKLRATENNKPPICGLLAMIDMVGYGFILMAEMNGQETDTFPEAFQRLLEDAWALGSYYNCMSRGADLAVRNGTLLIGGVMTIGNTVAAGVHMAYYLDHKEDDTYRAPSWSNSLSGSLL
ncbi:hypothetical protein FAGAP_4144 [Fusarium agapanthi]|uniref:Uncharacterized protein n=1 Tax=Fusarium agapanthi TaxID=1803897 RepID=A0A9P5BE06_9HYPO|nr:hypothetical protein FAGAP_4144 [Fusarium agapanthi]